MPPIIERDDGVTFAVYTYRELLTVKSASMLKQEIRVLQEEHGQYARFFELPSGDFEAVFSREQGYLLGETVWDYFDQPDDLIFCEALDDGKNAVLVVVRGGSVYLDAEVPIENLHDEFSSLATGSHSYDIRIYGDVPLSQQSTKEKFTFDEEFVNSFEILKAPVFPKLPSEADFELLPIANAMDELPLGNQKQIIIAALAIVIVIGLGWYFFKAEPPPVGVKDEVTSTPTIQKRAFEDYQKALTTPAPYDIFNELAVDLRQLFTLPGWVPTNIVYKDSKFTVELESIGGTLDILLAWARQNNANLSNKAQAATITFQSTALKREPPRKIFDMDDINAMVYDQLKSTVADGSVSYQDPVKSSNYSSTKLSVSFGGISLDVLTLLGIELRDLPVIVEECTIQVEDGLLSGTVILQILGTD